MNQAQESNIDPAEFLAEFDEELQINYGMTLGDAGLTDADVLDLITGDLPAYLVVQEYAVKRAWLHKEESSYA